MSIGIVHKIPVTLKANVAPKIDPEKKNAEISGGYISLGDLYLVKNTHFTYQTKCH